MKNEIVIDGVTYVIKEEVTKELELYDIVTYKNIEWYVIDIQEDEVKLMAKDIIGSVEYSLDNSNDWEFSKVRDYLAEWLLDSTIALEDLIGMTTNYDENRNAYDKIRIPTLREIEKLPMNIRNCGDSYWTMTSSYSVSENCSNAFVFLVASDGWLDRSRVDFAFGVRPVITLSTGKLE